jgi:hypothetical protein
MNQIDYGLLSDNELCTKLAEVLGTINLICPKCNNLFVGPENYKDIFCPLCKGTVRPVLQIHRHPSNPITDANDLREYRFRAWERYKITFEIEIYCEAVIVKTFWIGCNYKGERYGLGVQSHDGTYASIVRAESRATIVAILEAIYNH